MFRAASEPALSRAEQHVAECLNSDCGCGSKYGKRYLETKGQRGNQADFAGNQPIAEPDNPPQCQMPGSFTLNRCHRIRFGGPESSIGGTYAAWISYHSRPFYNARMMARCGNLPHLAMRLKHQAERCSVGPRRQEMRSAER